MIWKIQMMSVLVTVVCGSLQEGFSDHQLHSNFNSTDTDQLFKPIIIPNITDYFQSPHSLNDGGTVEVEKPQQDLQEEPKENSLKFSSRYSEKGNRDRTEQADETTDVGIIKEADSSRGDDSKRVEESFSDRSDDFSSSEEEKEDVRKYFDGNEPEESEVSPTTNEPYQDVVRPTSFRSGPYPDEDLENYETTSIQSEELDGSEEEEPEGKRSVHDYHNADSRNYHSVQTPLSKIHYRGPHSFERDYHSDRTRLVNPIRRHPIGHNWPYSRSQLKAELEKENEIPDSDERSLEEGIKEELKGKTLGLELAVKKDESKFDRNRKYNRNEEKNREKEKLKILAAAEEKDHRRLPFQSVQQYQVDEVQQYQYPKKISPTPQALWSSRSPLITTPKSPEIPKELASNFQGHQFLGPVVFDHSTDEKKYEVNGRKQQPKGLAVKEKLDQENLTNERVHKWVFQSVDSGHSFNHLEESDDMYNAILANIRSVFGARTHTRSQDSETGIELEESKSLTWSLPMRKSSKVNKGTAKGSKK